MVAPSLNALVHTAADDFQWGITLLDQTIPPLSSNQVVGLNAQTATLSFKGIVGNESGVG